MQRIRQKLLLAGAVLCTVSAPASSQLNGLWALAVPPPAANFPGTVYGAKANGIPSSPSFFPIIVFGQKPCLTGATGAFGTGTVASAEFAEGINIQLGMDMGTGSAIAWPGTFGGDNGELACLKAAGVKLIAGGDPYNNTTSPISVASATALVNSISAQGTWIGGSWADEPHANDGTVVPPGNATVYNSGSPKNSDWGVGSSPTENATILSELGTRPTVENMDGNAIYAAAFPSFVYNGTGSATQWLAAQKAPSFPSFDTYPTTNPFSAVEAILNGASVGLPDGNSVPADTMWTQVTGLLGQIANSGGENVQPQFVYIEDGSDELGASGSLNSFTGGIANGSAILAATTGYTFFGSAWIGMTVSGTGIPSGTVISSIVNSTHATMSHAATANNASVTVTVSGGVNGGPCVAGAHNLCLISGNEYRATAQDVAAEALMSVAHGANGLEEFPFDTVSNTFGLGDSASGGAAATAAANNMTWLHGFVRTWAAVFNALNVAACSGQHYTDWGISSSCTNGILTLASSSAQVPVGGRLKQVGSKYYLLVSALRRTGAGFNMTATVSGATSAQSCGDLRAKYDPGNATANGTTYSVSGGAFTDTSFATGGNVTDDHNFRIYAINGPC